MVKFADRIQHKKRGRSKQKSAARICVSLSLKGQVLQSSRNGQMSRKKPNEFGAVIINSFRSKTTNRCRSQLWRIKQHTVAYERVYIKSTFSRNSGSLFASTLKVFKAKRIQINRIWKPEFGNSKTTLGIAQTNSDVIFSCCLGSKGLTYIMYVL